MKKLLERIWQRRAFNSLAVNDYAKAERYFLKLKQLSPDTLGTDYNLGIVKLARNDFAAAEGYFLRDVGLFGETGTRCAALGDLYYIWGRREDAEKWYARALGGDDPPRQETTLKRRIEMCRSAELFERVRESHRLFWRGNELQKEERFEEAAAAFHAASELDPTNAEALNNEGSLLMNHFKDPGRAAACFEKSYRLSGLPLVGRNLQEARELQRGGASHA